MKSTSLCHRAAMDHGASLSLLRSFERHLRASTAPTTPSSATSTAPARPRRSWPPAAAPLTDAHRADLEAFLADLLTRRSASTTATRHKALRILYRWLEEEDEINQNPMARVKPPIVPEQPVPVVPEDRLRRLLAACAGKTFDDRRDTEISSCS
jgi:site-specific recombinase XerD